MQPREEMTFVICIDNEDYPASLERNKVYRVIPDEWADAHQQIRIIDESGEDYLFSAARFVHVELPEAAAKAFH